MSEIIRQQEKCDYATPEYAQTLWGKYGYIYQGQCALKVTQTAIILEKPPFRLQIPFTAVTSVGLGFFSRLAKMGLGYIDLRYIEDEKESAIFLVPRDTSLTVWGLNLHIESWIKTLQQIPALKPRIKQPLPLLPIRPTCLQVIALFLMVLPAILWCGWICSFFVNR